MRPLVVVLGALVLLIGVLVSCGGDSDEPATTGRDGQTGTGAASADSEGRRPGPSDLGTVIRCLEGQGMKVSTRPDDFDLVAQSLIDEGVQVAVVTEPGEVQIAIDPDEVRARAAAEAWRMWIHEERQLMTTDHAVAAFSFPPTERRAQQIQRCLPD